MKLKAACCTALLLGLLVSPAMAATITVRIDPQYQEVDISAGTAIARIKAHIPQADAIIGWGLDLTLTGTSIGLAPDLPGDPNPLIPSPPFDPAYAPDGDHLAALVPPPNVVFGYDVLLATVKFNLLELGTTLLDLSYTLTDLTEGLMTESGYAAVTFEGGSITVIPEPAALALLALGVLAMRRR